VVVVVWWLKGHILSFDGAQVGHRRRRKLTEMQEIFENPSIFKNPNPGMIFSRVESLCTTHSNL
jgi:hypothetical protein